MILQPQQYFAICRQIADPSDSTVYYIQAIIRDASTDTLLDTVNLDSKGTGRWRKNWQVPTDPSNQGRYITITTRVYDDAGYTTLNGNYGAEEREYLIQRINNRYSGGGGGDITSKDIRKLFQEELAKLPEPPARQEVDLKPVLAALQSLQERDTSETDLSPVLVRIEALLSKMSDLEAKPELDIPDYRQELSDISSSIKEYRSAWEEKAQEIVDTAMAKMEEDYEAWQADLTEKIATVLDIIMQKDGREDKVAKAITSLMEKGLPENEPEENTQSKMYRSRAGALIS